MENNTFTKDLNDSNIFDGCQLFLDNIGENKWTEEQNIKLRKSLLCVDAMLLNKLPKCLLGDWCEGLSEYNMASDLLSKISSNISSTFDFIVFKLQEKDIMIGFDFSKEYITDFLKTQPMSVPDFYLEDKNGIKVLKIRHMDNQRDYREFSGHYLELSVYTDVMFYVWRDIILYFGVNNIARCCEDFILNNIGEYMELVDKFSVNSDKDDFIEGTFKVLYMFCLANTVTYQFSLSPVKLKRYLYSLQLKYDRYCMVNLDNLIALEG